MNKKVIIAILIFIGLWAIGFFTGPSGLRRKIQQEQGYTVKTSLAKRWANDSWAIMYYGYKVDEDNYFHAFIKLSQLKPNAGIVPLGTVGGLRLGNLDGENVYTLLEKDGRNYYYDVRICQLPFGTNPEELELHYYSAVTN